MLVLGKGRVFKTALAVLNSSSSLRARTRECITKRLVVRVGVLAIVANGQNKAASVLKP